MSVMIRVQEVQDDRDCFGLFGAFVPCNIAVWLLRLINLYTTECC